MTHSSEQDLPECEMCGMISRNLITHITKTHKITCASYRIQYPNSKIFLARKKEKKGSKRSQNVLELKEAGVDPLVCRLCGFESYMSLTSHISRKHKFSMSAYRELYPNDVIQRDSPTTNAKNRQVQIDRLRDPEERKKWDEQRYLPPTMKEFRLKKGFSDELAEQQAREMRIKISKIKPKPTRIAKLSKKSSGKNNPMSLESIAKRHGVDITEASKLTPCHGRSGEKHPMYGKNHTQESIEKIANADNLKHPKWCSVGEKQLAEFCRSLGDTQENVRLGKYNVDVLFSEKRLIVEYFGNLWHMSPQKFSSDQYHYLTKKTAQQVWDRDSKKLESLTDLGYSVIVIWESDWKRDRVSCEAKVIDAYNKAR